MADLTGKSVVVTGIFSSLLRSLSQDQLLILAGGASGIGLAIVRFFAVHSTKIRILDISAASAETVVSSLQAEFPSTTFLFKKCDISSWDQQKAVFADLYKETGSIDYVFANAGVSEIGNFLDKDAGEPVKPALKTIDINLVGTLYSESDAFNQVMCC
jgi:NAD(P)-dependent dehydrogenase (short-subunit alcohol dehydrogenase family)